MRVYKNTLIYVKFEGHFILFDDSVNNGFSPPNDRTCFPEL